MTHPHHHASFPSTGFNASRHEEHAPAHHHSVDASPEAIRSPGQTLAPRHFFRGKCASSSSDA